MNRAPPIAGAGPARRAADRVRVTALRCAGGQVSIGYADGRIDVYGLAPAFFGDLAFALDDSGWLALRAALSRPGQWVPVEPQEELSCEG